MLVLYNCTFGITKTLSEEQVYEKENMLKREKNLRNIKEPD
jgi:hypothetical protein